MKKFIAYEAVEIVATLSISRRLVNKRFNKSVEAAIEAFKEEHPEYKDSIFNKFRTPTGWKFTITVSKVAFDEEEKSYFPF